MLSRILDMYILHVMCPYTYNAIGYTYYYNNEKQFISNISESGHVQIKTIQMWCFCFYFKSSFLPFVVVLKLALSTTREKTNFAQCKKVCLPVLVYYLQSHNNKQQQFLQFQTFFSVGQTFIIWEIYLLRSFEKVWQPHIKFYRIITYL